MTKSLRALIVEDNERDAELLVRELRRAGYAPAFERVETAEALRAALAERSWQIVLSDWAMPRFSALAALAVVQEVGIDIPFIIVSGTIGERTAVEAMRAGAHDFMRKDELARLLPAIERELREASIRKDRRKMQEQLLLSDRMASIGQLAAGVAHEINNPLAALMANIDFAIRDLAHAVESARSQPVEGDSPAGHVSVEWLGRRFAELDESLQDARESAERVRHIVRDLKIFSRAGEEETRGPVDVRRVLESSLRMAANEIRHRAVLVKEFAAVPPVAANESRLGQVFLNLVINAAQAIPEGRADKNEIRVRTAISDERFVRVEVSDSGVGISAEALTHIFDPFFTTKPVGVGTGLGLAICHRIITSLGGEISVESEQGKGTTFSVLVPIATEVEESPAPLVRPVTARKGRLLVIDDEPLLAQAIARMLTREQHEVVTLQNARRALERLVAGERFDVILCDLMMPEMSGMEFHAELERALPELLDRLVFMTGGAFTPAAREFLDRVPTPRLEKPFNPTNLHLVVQSLLR
ncbi:MAG: response regulator [Labilithrix sp.]|nr:response regulator [Labilithrix sp.]